MPAQLTPCSLASISPSVSLSLSPLPGSPAAPQTHDALSSPWLFLLTKGRAWQGLVKISLITQKTNCYFSICQVAEDKDVKPRIRVNIRSTVTPVCLCSRQAFQFFFKIMVQFPERETSDNLSDVHGTGCDSLRTQSPTQGRSSSHKQQTVGHL